MNAMAGRVGFDVMGLRYSSFHMGVLLSLDTAQLKSAGRKRNGAPVVTDVHVEFPTGARRSW